MTGGAPFSDSSTDKDEKITVICHPNGKIDVFYDDPDGGTRQRFQVTDLVIKCKQINLPKIVNSAAESFYRSTVE